jgi:hypothetical protein
MNVNENNHDRLKRIEVISRIVRYVALALLVLSAGYWLLSLIWLSPAWVKQNPLQTGLGFLMQLVLWTWYWKLAKLFHLYQRGLVFAHEAIRCIKVLGLLCVINWFVTSAWHGTYYLFPAPHQPILPVGVIGTIHQSPVIVGFFSFSIGGINVGMLLAGIIIVIIAWIMDEGRKIQEEQELTV